MSPPQADEFTPSKAAKGGRVEGSHKGKTNEEVKG